MSEFQVTDTGFKGDPNDIMAWAKSDVNESAPTDDANTGTSPADPNAGDKDAPKDADGKPVPPTPIISAEQEAQAGGTGHGEDNPDSEVKTVDGHVEDGKFEAHEAGPEIVHDDADDIDKPIPYSGDVVADEHKDGEPEADHDLYR